MAEYHSNDLPEQRICRLFLDNRIAKILGAVAIAVQLILPPLIFEGMLNTSQRLLRLTGTVLMEGAAERSEELLDALKRGIDSGISRAMGRRNLVIGENIESTRDF